MEKILIISLIAIILSIVSLLFGIMWNRAVTKRRDKVEKMQKIADELCSNISVELKKDKEEKVGQILMSPIIYQNVSFKKTEISIVDTKLSKSKPAICEMPNNRRFGYKKQYDKYVKNKEGIAAWIMKIV